MAARCTILLIEDDLVDQLAFKRLVKTERLPYDYSVAGSVAEARALLSSQRFDLIVADHQLGDGTVFDIFALDTPAPIIVTTGTGREEIAVKAMKAGAYDYLIKDHDRNYLQVLPLTIEHALRRQEVESQIRILSSALMTSRDSVYVTDLDGRVTFVNPAFCRTYGYAAEEILGQPSLVLWHGTPAQVGELTWGGEVIHQRRDSTQFPALLTSALVRDDKGNPVAMVSVARDITDRKRAEEALRQSEARLDYLLRHFVPAAVAEHLKTSGELPHPGGELRTVTAFFADARGYTSIAERGPLVAMEVLNQHFEVISRMVVTQGGIITQYAGDMIMAIFNAFGNQPDHAWRAVRAGLATRAALETLHQSSQKLAWGLGELPETQFGVGINTGFAVVGFLGFEERFDYTAIGDTTNVAFHLSGQARGGQILIGPQTYDLVREQFQVQPIGLWDLKGKSAQLPVYEVTGEAAA